MTVEDHDRASVRALLGREPLGSFEVVVRDGAGEPVVIRNAPHLDDGTPMPTRYWLVGPAEVLAVSRLESAGGVRRAEAETDPAAVAEAHRRYAAERETATDDHEGPAPAGGVGGTRTGVKCLHAHYAWFLAGGDDPVGRWVAAQLARRLDVGISRTSTVFTLAGRDHRVPVGPATLLADELADPDPATAAQLTNAIGIVMDHVDDVVRTAPGIIDAHDVHVGGPDAWHLATVEQGRPAGTAEVVLARDDVEDVFRTLATESRADRLHNPGLDPAQVDSVLATCCVVVGVMRRLQLADHDRRSRRRGRVMARHPSAGAKLPVPLRLYGRRVTLRPLTAPDFAEWSEVRRRNDAWLTPWEPRRPPSQLDPTLNRDAFTARCSARDRDAASGVAYGFGVFVDHRLTGEANLNSVLRGAMQSGTVGYWVDQARAGQGLIAESVVVLATFAFEQLDLHRLEICIVPRNHNSRRVMEKLQFREEGIALRYLEINGIWEDHVRYGFTVEEWADRRDELLQAWL